MKVVFDVNVVVDVPLGRAPYPQDVTAVLVAVERGWLEGLLCATTITTVSYIGSQSYGRAHVKLKDLLALFTVAPVTHAILG